MLDNLSFTFNNNCLWDEIIVNFAGGKVLMVLRRIHGKLEVNQKYDVLVHQRVPFDLQPMSSLSKFPAHISWNIFQVWSLQHFEYWKSSTIGDFIFHRSVSINLCWTVWRFLYSWTRGIGVDNGACTGRCVCTGRDAGTGRDVGVINCAM